MPKTVSEITVFVAAPGDVSAEVAQLEDVIKDLNVIHEDQIGVRLKPVHWRTDVRPGVGSDAQAVINEQIGDNYDIFIGILWKDFGTPTPRAPSGTIEEFERAFKRAKADPDGVKVLFYFKDLPPTSLQDIDPQSLAEINQFRASWRCRGLYSQFMTTSEFGSLVLKHLGKLQMEWGRTWGQSLHARKAPQRPASPAAVLEPQLQPEPGYLDYFDDYEENLEMAMASFAGWNDSTNDLSSDLRERIASSEGRMRAAKSARDVAAVVEFVMHPVVSLAASLDKEMPDFRAAHCAAREKLSLATTALLENYDESDSRHLQRVLQRIREVESDYSGGLIKMQELLDSAQGWGDQLPGVSEVRRRLSRPLRAVRTEMRSFLTSMQSGAAVMERVMGEQRGAPRTEANPSLG